MLAQNPRHGLFHLDILFCFVFLQSFFAERLFAYFDADGSGSITLDELKTGLRLLTQGAPIDKLKLLFTVYDVDGKFRNNSTCSEHDKQVNM